MFNRCLEDNGKIEPTPKEAIASRVLPLYLQHHDTFYICPNCRRVVLVGNPRGGG